MRFCLKPNLLKCCIFSSRTIHFYQTVGNYAYIEEHCFRHNSNHSLKSAWLIIIRLPYLYVYSQVKIYKIMWPITWVYCYIATITITGSRNLNIIVCNYLWINCIRCESIHTWGYCFNRTETREWIIMKSVSTTHWGWKLIKSLNTIPVFVFRICLSYVMLNLSRLFQLNKINLTLGFNPFNWPRKINARFLSFSSLIFLDNGRYKKCPFVELLSRIFEFFVGFKN